MRRPAVRLVCPTWASPGQPLHVEAGPDASRFVVTVPPGVSPGDSFLVRLAGLSPADAAHSARVVPPSPAAFTARCPVGAGAGDRITVHPPGRPPCDVVVPAGVEAGGEFVVLPPPADRPPGRVARARALCCPTGFAGVIWLVVALNYAALVGVAPQRWQPLTYAAGHALLALQVASYFATMLTPPGAVPESWCGDMPLPPRARFVRRHGEAVLAFDHFCFWLGVPIGLRNRKPFVLYLCYSALLVLFALCLVAYELRRISGGLTWRPSTTTRADLAGGASLGVLLGSLKLVFLSLDEQTQEWAVWCFCLAVVDLIGVGLLVPFAAFHLQLVLYNRTSLGGDEAYRYDIGWAANWRQVFGARRSLWLLPIIGDGPTVDGLHWPENPRFVVWHDHEAVSNSPARLSRTREEELQLATVGSTKKGA
ncbi:hypothetical protein AB1Y20_006134 [Prymnesium parvum]|uniref:Palmitoyltransferase n=1 Tax=Prymnesium parvum TaxID=97485 RepID=A0AB34J1S7_PRYPA